MIITAGIRRCFCCLQCLEVCCISCCMESFLLNRNPDPPLNPDVLRFIFLSAGVVSILPGSVRPSLFTHAEHTNSEQHPHNNNSHTDKIKASCRSNTHSLSHKKNKKTSKDERYWKTECSNISGIITNRTVIRLQLKKQLFLKRIICVVQKIL